MKNHIFRLSSLVLALVMLLTMFAGCNKPDGTIENGGSTDNSTTAAPIQITTTIHEIAKHGNLVLYMYGADLFDKGFAHGDMVEISIGEKTWDVPLCTSYSDVDNGEVVLRATGETDGVVLAINMGDFATTAGIAQKSAIEEEPGYRWDYLMEEPVQITITLKEEDGYREQWLIRQLVRTNERADYAHLSDEAFANFRVIETTGMGKGVLYRSSSPINPALGRNTYADKAAKDAGILTVVNLADPSNTYEGTENTYYSTCQVTYVNLGADFLSETTLQGLAEGMRFIIHNNGPYLIHCNEGKDRAGFVSALLECLMGATLDEVIDDYMVTYYNYYGVEEGTEKYAAIVKNNLIQVLNTTFRVEDISKADLAAEAAAFLMEDAGLTVQEVAALKGKLTITLREIYDACQTEALLRNHESVTLRNQMDGELFNVQYLTKDYAFHFIPSTEGDWAEFMTDNAYYACLEEVYVCYLPVSPAGVGDGYAAERAAKYGSVILGEEALEDTIESVEIKDGRITVTSVLNSETLAILAAEGITAGKSEYVLDANTREMISIKIDYIYGDGSVFCVIAELNYDEEAPEMLEQFLGYGNQTENLRKITVISNPGTGEEVSQTVQIPKGVVAGFNFADEVADAFCAYTDAACSESYDPYADTESDLTVYVKWSK